MRNILICLLLLIVPLSAQEKSRSWSIRVAALDCLPGHEILWLRTGAGKEPMKIPLNGLMFSLPIKFKCPAAIAFYGSAMDARAEEPPAPLGSTILKHDHSLIVFSARPDKGNYNSYAINESDFPFGAFRFVNFSKAIIRTELKGKALVLKPGAAGTVAYSGERNDTNVRILALAEGEPPRIVLSSRWAIFSSQRELVMIFPGTGGELVRFQHFVDTKSLDPEE